MAWELRKNSGELLGAVEHVDYGLTRNKIETLLLDGTPMVQTVGSPAESPTVTVLVKSQEAQRAVNEAEATGELVRCEYHGRVMTGYLSGVPRWQPALKGKWYRTSVKLLLV